MADSELNALDVATADTGGIYYGEQSGASKQFTVTAAGAALLEDANAATQRTTLGLGTMATQAASAVAITGGTITGISALGITPAVNGAAITVSGVTHTASAPILDAAQTWNGGGVTFDAFKINVTNTASAGASRLINLQVGGASKFNVNVSGTGTLVNGLDAGRGTYIDYWAAASVLITSDTALITLGAGNDIGLSRISAGVLGLGTGGLGSYAGSLKLTNIEAVGDITLASGSDLILDSAGSGTKIGTATSQKLGFWNVGPTTQPAGETTSGYAGAGSGNAVLDDTVFDGGSGNQYSINGLIASLKAIGIIG